MKISFGIKLLILFGMMTALFIGLAVYSGSDLKHFSAYTEKYKGVHSNTKNARELQINIANVWQFLTDASLTKDENVVTDKALTAYNEAKKRISELIKLNERQDKKIIRLKDIERDLPEMWNIGNRMFEAYLTDWDQGNRLMNDYDAISNKLINELDKFTQEISTEEDVMSAGINNDIHKSMRVFAVIIIVGMIIAGVVAYFLRTLNNAIVKPVHALKVATARIMEGDLSVDVSEQFVSGEVGALAKGFNAMVKEIRGIVNEVKDGTMQLSGSAEALSEVGKIIIEGFQNQDMKSSQVAAAAHELSATFTDVAGSTSSAAESVKDASNFAASGETIMESSVHSIDGIAATTKETSELITVLGKRSQEVGNIIKVIDDIAHQTNLLALNAAIEAARAGEQGRGFAVVADEVRKLAEKTTGATKEITNMIKAIQADTDRALQSMQREIVSVEEGVGFARGAGSALNPYSAVGSQNYWEEPYERSVTPRHFNICNQRRLKIQM